jgi:hypothetical protein
MIFKNPILQSAPQPVEGSANLTGQQWLVRLSWNDRLRDGAGGWLVDLFFSDGSSMRPTDADGNALPRGVVVRESDDLWEPYRYLPTFPPGRLAAYRSDGTDEPPGLDEIGTTFTIEYIEPTTEV